MEQKYAARKQAPDMEVSILEKEMLQTATASRIPLPNLQIVWHDYKDVDIELCVAQGPLGFPCGLTALYGDGPDKTSMKYCEIHKFYEGFTPTHILQDIEEKDNLDD